jgi:hypothetical protein
LIAFILPFIFHCPHDFMSWLYLYFLLYFNVLMTFMSWLYLYSLLYFIVLMTFMSSSYLYFLLHFMSSWLSWVDRIYISFLYFIVIMTFMSWLYLHLLSLWYILILQVHIWWYWSYSLIIQSWTKVLRLL